MTFAGPSFHNGAIPFWRISCVPLQMVNSLCVWWSAIRLELPRRRLQVRASLLDEPESAKSVGMYPIRPLV
jgi:hypothetical protein